MMSLQAVTADAARVSASLARAPKLPVIVIGGLDSTPATYTAMRTQLTELGLDSYVLALPKNSWASIETDARALAELVTRVRTKTGAEGVHLLGHSKGGLTALEYLAHHGGMQHVRGLITLGTPVYGVTPLQGLSQAMLAGKLTLLPGPIARFVDTAPALSAMRSRARRFLAQAMASQNVEARAIRARRGPPIAYLTSKLTFVPAPIRDIMVGGQFLTRLRTDLRPILESAHSTNPRLRIVNVAAKWRLGSDGSVPNWSSHLRGPREVVRHVTLTRQDGNAHHMLLPEGNERLTRLYREVFLGG